MEVTQSWFVAKAAIALGPIIGFGTADMIRGCCVAQVGSERADTKRAPIQPRQGEASRTSSSPSPRLKARAPGSRSPNPQRCVRSQNDRLP